MCRKVSRVGSPAAGLAVLGTEMMCELRKQTLPGCCQRGGAELQAALV